MENAGAGILVEFTTADHNGLNISNIYATGIAGIVFAGSNGAADGIESSARNCPHGPEW